MEKLTLSGIIDEFNKMNNKEKLSIMYGALENMESYNGRSKRVCIALAMEYEESENDFWVKVK